MASLKLVLLVAFFVCEGLAAFGVGGKINLVAAGLACFAATLIF